MELEDNLKIFENIAIQELIQFFEVGEFIMVDSRTMKIILLLL
jgi:hypothetical protein